MGESKDSKLETLKAIKLRKQVLMILNQGKVTLEKSKRKGEDTISSIASLYTVSDQIKETLKAVNQFVPISPSNEIEEIMSDNRRINTVLTLNDLLYKLNSKCKQLELSLIHI